MPLANTSTVRYSLRRSDGAYQILRVRLGYSRRLISRSPSAGLPYEILHETPLTRMRDALFPLPLRELEDPRFCEAYVAQLLCSFELGRTSSDAIARKITLSVVELAAEDYEVKFQLVADIDYIQTFWATEKEDRSSVGVGNNVGRSVMMEEIVVLEAAGRGRGRGAPETAMERVKKKKVDGFGLRRQGLEDCSICYDELNVSRKEVARIPCGHVYHKSCILTWLQRSSTCPLCRRKLDHEI